jgi:hypothetical protein
MIKTDHLDANARGNRKDAGMQTSKEVEASETYLFEMIAGAIEGVMDDDGFYEELQEYILLTSQRARDAVETGDVDVLLNLEEETKMLLLRRYALSVLERMITP